MYTILFKNENVLLFVFLGTMQIHSMAFLCFLLIFIKSHKGVEVWHGGKIVVESFLKVAFEFLVYLYEICFQDSKQTIRKTKKKVFDLKKTREIMPVQK